MDKDTRRDQRRALSWEIMLAVGMSVDICQFRLGRQQQVDIAFQVNCGDQVRQCKAKGVVVHSRKGTVGLRFKGLDSCVRQMLRRRLFGYATVSQRTYLAQNATDFGHAVGFH